MFRSMFVKNQIMKSGLKKSIRLNTKRCLCAELVKRKFCQVLNTPNRRIFAKPQWIIQMRNYANLPSHIKVKLPALSPTMLKGNILSWTKKEGDKLSEGDLLCEIETDKATMNFDTPEEGYLAKIVLPAGAKDVPVGKLLCIIVTEAADVAAFKDFKDDSPDPAPDPAAAPAPAAAAPAPAAAAPAPSAAVPAGGRVYASPMARKLSAIKNLRLQGKGSGLYGSLKSTDLSAAGAAAPATLAPGAAAGPASPGVGYVDIPLTSMRATIAQRLTAAKQTTPHFQLTATVNIEKTLAMKNRINQKLAVETTGVKLSINDFIVKAVAAACKRVPEVNAHWMETFIRQYSSVDVSVAVATPTGLLTPILFNCDCRGIIDLSKNMKELAERARLGTLQPSEFQGGTVTVSNLGMYGITMFNAIINPPQSLILACGGLQDIVIPGKKLKDKDTKGFRIGKFVMFTASVNHCVVDGALGALWMKALKENLEDPANMIL